MSYQIVKSNGNTITVTDNTLDSTFSIQLVGKNRTNYGTPLNQNFFRLMENFASQSAPINPQSGQLWWDTNGFLKVYTGNGWKPVSGAMLSTPSLPVAGDLWFDGENKQLKIYDTDSRSWILIGPAARSGQALNGFVTEIITGDPDDTRYYVATMYANGTRIAILSKDSITGVKYNGSSLTGFTSLSPGVNYNTAYAGLGTYWGNITGTTANLTGTANVANLQVTSTANVAGTANILGNIIGNTHLSITGNIKAGNINSVSGILSVTGNANVGNLGTAGLITATGNVTGGNLVTGGKLAVTGNANLGNVGATGGSITGNLYVGKIGATSGAAYTLPGSDGSNGQVLTTYGNAVTYWATVSGGGSGAVDAGNIYEVAYYNATGTTVKGAGAGFTWNGSLLTVGNANVSANANIIGNATVGNLTTNGLITAVGNVTGGNIIAANVVVSNAFASGNSNIRVFQNANIAMSVTGTSNVLLVTASNATITGNLTVSANTTVANINATGGTVTGNITIGNVIGNVVGKVGVSGGPSYSLPVTDGSSGQLLATYANGVTYWASVTGGGGGSGTVNSGTATQLAYYATSTDAVSSLANVTFTGNVFTVNGNITAGLIQATGAGIKFPDNTVQTSAAASGVPQFSAQSSSFTATANTSYFITGNNVVVTLPNPAPDNNTFVHIVDGANVTGCTVNRVTANIMGRSENLTFDTGHFTAKLVYRSATNDWRLV